MDLIIGAILALPHTIGGTFAIVFPIVVVLSRLILALMALVIFGAILVFIAGISTMFPLPKTSENK